jgi:hypothetical protein
MALPATALAAEPDPHPAWLAEWQRLVDWCNSTGPGDRDLQDCPEWHRSMELEDLIASTPARTLAGAVCQLRLTHYYAGAAFPDDPADVAAANALVTLERLAGGQAHV